MIAYLMPKNRRKSAYRQLDGNPLALRHFKGLDSSITLSDLQNLVRIGILKEEEYIFSILQCNFENISIEEKAILETALNNILNIDTLKNNRSFKLSKLPIFKLIDSLKLKGIIRCVETRFDFKNTKISTSLNGVNRIFLPSSNIFPTLVASDSNDYIALEDVEAINADAYKKTFLKNIYNKGKFRKITKEEACLVQGFPHDFILSTSRPRWMKLIGNSVSVSLNWLSKVSLKVSTLLL